MGVTVCGPAEQFMTGTDNCKPSAAGFEGFEKRLELEFVRTAGYLNDKSLRYHDQGRGLRAIPRDDLDKILTAAQCTIVSELSNDHCDSYILSESSLFVYPLRIVLKTCGTTQLLLAIPALLQAVASLQLHLEVRRCKYTRGSFMFPSAQLYPHGNFNDEVIYLQNYFGHLGSGGKAFVMGNFPNWHIYMAAAADDDGDQFQKPSSDHVVDSDHEPTYTMEVCMTELDRAKARQFFNEDGSSSGRDMTKASAIDSIIPSAQVCDFSFIPCGYSMNALEPVKAAHSTIHVTPEDEYSYASFESMGYGPKDTNLQTLLDRVSRVFEPAKLSVSLQVTSNSGVALPWFEDSDQGGRSWCASINPPRGYVCEGTTRRAMPGGKTVVTFHTFHAIAAPGAGAVRLSSWPVIPLPLMEFNDEHKNGHDDRLWAEPGEHRAVMLTERLDRRCHDEEARKVQNDESGQSNLNYDLPLRDAWEMCSRHGRQNLDVFSAVNPVGF